MDFEVKLNGFEELKARLQKASGPKAERLLTRALKDGAKVIQGAIKERTPVRETKLTGTGLPAGALRADINIYAIKSKTTGERTVLVKPGKHTRHLAGWLEYGHEMYRDTGIAVGAKGRKKGSKRNGGSMVTRVEAEPFFRPGYEDSRNAAQEVITARLQADLANLEADAPTEEEREGDD